MKYTMKDFVEQRIAVNCRTKDERAKFLEMCETYGLKWRSGAKPTERVVLIDYGDKFCIACESAQFMERKICYCDDSHFRKNGWKIVNFSDIAQEKKKDNGFFIVISCLDGKTTTAELMKTGKDGYIQTVKTVEAKCNPADKFNLRIGAQTAFDRLRERSAK